MASDCALGVVGARVGRYSTSRGRSVLLSLGEYLSCCRILMLLEDLALVSLLKSLLRTNELGLAGCLRTEGDGFACGWRAVEAHFIAVYVWMVLAHVQAHGCERFTDGAGALCGLTEITDGIHFADLFLV